MKIELHKIVPAPLSGTFLWHPVWGQDFSFSPGSNFLLKAASGKGKSTLLHILYGLRRDFSGTLSFDGRDTSAFPFQQWSELRNTQLSMVFQDLRLFPDLTAEENIRLKGNLWKDWNWEEIHTYAVRMKVDQLLKRSCKTLSLGQQQRIAILRALSQPFSFLLMDEPFSHLDQENIEIIKTILEEVCEKRKASFMISSLGEDYGLTNTQILEI